MKNLLKYLKGYTKECVLGPLFKLLEASFELMVPLVVAAIIDQGIATKDSGYVITRVLFLVALGAVGLISAVTAQYFAAKAATGFAAKLRHALFVHINTLSFSEIDEVGTSKMITRMTSDVNSVQNCVNMVLRLFLRSPFIVFGAMIMAFTVNVECAWIFCVLIPALSVVVFGILLISIPLYKKVQNTLDGTLKMTRENLNGTRVIRAFNKEEEECENFNRNTDRLSHYQRKAGRISALMNPLTFVLVNVALVVLINVGAIKVDAGGLTQGQVVALVNYMSQILVELIKLANLILQVPKAVASGDRIDEILKLENTMEFPLETKRETSEESEYSIEFRHASLTYKNSKEASVKDVDIRIKRGETIGIIGGTGSGKSSLVHMIPRFYDASEGSVLIDGIDVKDYAKEDLRGQIAIVLQKAVLFSGTLRDNMKWGNENADDEAIKEALIQAQAWDFVEDKGEGLDLMLEQGGRNLSGGQRQRLTIARALVAKPKILILDDSASALDYATDAKLRAAIAKMGERGDLTVMIVSQRTASLRSANRIMVLEDGEVAGIGTNEELLANCQVYREIYASDSQEPLPQMGGVV